MADFIGCEYIKKTVTEVFMKRIRITVAYDGTDYCGWQIQPNGITVEEVLNRGSPPIQTQRPPVSG